MNHSSLVELFKTLTIKELKGFSAFLDSPYFGKGRYKKEAKNLFDTLSKHAPDSLEAVDLGKEKMYRKVFPGEAFVEGRLEKVMVELSKSLRTFLLLERYLGEEHQAAAQADFAQVLLDRQLSQKASNLIHTLMEELGKAPAKSTDTYALLQRLSAIAYSIETRKNTWREDLNIGKTLRYLDLHYFATRLQLLNHYLLLSKLARVEAGIDLSKEKQLYGFFEVAPEESPTVFIAQKIFELYLEKSPAPASFEMLLGLLHTHQPNLNEEETKRYFVFLRNYCSVLIKAGHQDILPILHRIQRDNLEKGYFYYNGQIPPGAFLSISNAALRVEDFDWAYDFIQSHELRIMGDNDTRDYYRFAMANYLFHLGKYEASLGQIPPVSPNLDYHLLARCLELMNYYELDSELLPYKIDAFKMYLSRGRQKFLSEDYYESNNNFVNLLFQLVQSRPGDPKRKETLLRRIEEKKQVMVKDWLIEKVKKLK